MNSQVHFEAVDIWLLAPNGCFILRRTLEFYNVINDALLARSRPAARAKVYTCTDTSIDVLRLIENDDQFPKRSQKGFQLSLSKKSA